MKKTTSHDDKEDEVIVQEYESGYSAVLSKLEQELSIPTVESLYRFFQTSFLETDDHTFHFFQSVLKDVWCLQPFTRPFDVPKDEPSLSQSEPTTNITPTATEPTSSVKGIFQKTRTPGDDPMGANTPVNALSSLATPSAKEVRHLSSSSSSSSNSSSSSSTSSAKVMSSEADKRANSRKRTMLGD